MVPRRAVAAANAGLLLLALYQLYQLLLALHPAPGACAVLWHAMAMWQNPMFREYVVRYVVRDGGVDMDDSACMHAWLGAALEARF